MEVMSSPYRHGIDSPSRQLLHELGRLANAAQRDLYARLDREYSEREAVHKYQLAVAATEHERIRRNAEIAREKLQLQVEAERRQRDEEERVELDRRRREDAAQKLEAQQRETERLNNLKAEEDRLQIAKRSQAEAAAALQQKQKAAKERQDAVNAQTVREKEAADTKILEEAEAKLKATEARDAAIKAQAEQHQQRLQQQLQQQQQEKCQEQAASTSKSQKLDPSLVAEHNRYVEIHKRLKDLRKYMVIQSTHDAALKARMGDGRRAIRKCVGQLTGDAAQRQKPLAEIMAVLNDAAKTVEPSVNIFMFLSALPPQDNTTDNRGPALLIYQLSIFSKAVISQWVTEAGATPKAAEPIGIVASTIFSQPQFQWNGSPLIDILLAKLHVVCPVLFGIYGNDKTEQGREKLGWLRESPKGPFIQEQRHNERMTGLGAGFAAISLRNYAKSQRVNAYPSHNYWRSFAHIVNTSPPYVTSTHFVVLKAMIENYEQKILTAFGDMAIPALRKALVEFPASVKEPGVAGKSLALLVDMLRRDRKLGL